MRPACFLPLTLVAAVTTGCATALPADAIAKDTGSPGAAQVRPAAGPASIGAPTQPCSGDGWCWDEATSQGNDLLGVWAASPRDVWAVGDHGTVLHFDGARWNAVPFPDQGDLIAVTGSGPGSRRVWVGGRELLHYDGQTWRSEDLGAAESMSSLAYARDGAAIAASGRGAVVTHPPR